MRTAKLSGLPRVRRQIKEYEQREDEEHNDGGDEEQEIVLYPAIHCE